MKALLVAALLLSAGLCRGADSVESALAGTRSRQNDPDAWAELADAYRGAGRIRESAQALSRALELAPGEYEFHVRLAQDLAALGRLEQARAEFSRAKAIDGKAADAYIDEGYAELDAGQAERAERSFQEAVAADPADPLAYHHLASFFFQRGDLAQAERCLRKALALFDAQPRPSVFDKTHTLHNLALVLEAEDRPAEAKGAIFDALELLLPLRAPAKPDVRLLCWAAMILDSLGHFYQSSGESALAEQSFQEGAAVAGPQAPCVYFRLAPLGDLASLYAEQGRKRQAEAQAGQAWRLFQQAGATAAMGGDLIGQLGRVYARLGEDAKAEAAFRVVLRSRDEMESNVNFAGDEGALADLLVKSGRRLEAEGLYRDAARVAREHGRPSEAADLEKRLAKLTGR